MSITYIQCTNNKRRKRKLSDKQQSRRLSKHIKNLEQIQNHLIQFYHDAAHEQIHPLKQSLLAKYAALVIKQQQEGEK